MRGRRVLLAGVALGALTWLASPLLTGFREPWDAPSRYYVGCLIGTGVLLGALGPGRFWLGALGLLMGQVVVFGAYALLPPQELWLLGLVALVMYSLLGLGGAVAGAVGATVVSWLRRPRSPGSAAR